MGTLYQASSAYEKVDLHAQVEGANAHEIISLLLRGAVSKLAKAKGHIHSRDITAKGQEIGKVISIVSELQNNLIKQETSEISDGLDSLYTYITELIVTANINNDEKKIDEAVYLLNHLRESWNLIPDEHRY